MLRVACCVLHLSRCRRRAYVAWRKSQQHVACGCCMLHRLSCTLQCSRSHAAYSGCMLHGSVACCPARSLRTVIARCNDRRILGFTSHIGIHVASCMFHVLRPPSVKLPLRPHELCLGALAHTHCRIQVPHDRARQPGSGRGVPLLPLFHHCGQLRPGFIYLFAASAPPSAFAARPAHARKLTQTNGAAARRKNS